MALFKQAPGTALVARVALLIAAGCLPPAAPAVAEEDAPPVAVCPNPEISFAGVLTVPGGPPVGAEYVVCMPAPEEWNGDVIVFAHGTVDLREEPGRIASIRGQLDVNGLIVPGVANDLGYAFAALSRSDLGLSEAELAKAELIELVATFEAAVEAAPVFPSFDGLVYLVGPSQGGLWTVLLVEQAADVFDGGLAACGPIGSFRGQVAYWGDLLAVFDYFFPQFALMNPPDQVPPTEGDVAVVREDFLSAWDEGLGSAIRTALEVNPDVAREIAAVVGVATDDGELAAAEAIFGALREAALAANDGIAKLGGNPFDNSRRLYRGSSDDARLNREVKRYEANPDALATIAALYDTSGALGGPLVTIHTLREPRVPYWHETRYLRKVLRQGALTRYVHLPIPRFGHCAFEPAEVLAAFTLLVLRVEGLNIVLDVARALVDAEQRERFWALAGRLGLDR